jgi:hypothetical protein
MPHRYVARNLGVSVPIYRWIPPSERYGALLSASRSALLYANLGENSNATFACVIQCSYCPANLVDKYAIADAC